MICSSLLIFSALNITEYISLHCFVKVTKLVIQMFYGTRIFVYVLCLAYLSCLGDSQLLRTADMWCYDGLEKDSPPCDMTAHPKEEGMHYDFSKVTAATPLVEQTGFGSRISGVWSMIYVLYNKKLFSLAKLLLLSTRGNSTGETDIKMYIIYDICAFKVITVL